MAPAGHFGMVSPSEHFGHFPAPKLCRAGVLRLFKESRRPKALCYRRFRVAHHPWDQASHGLDHETRSHFPAGQNNIAHRDLVVNQVLSHALVDAFVAATQQTEA